VRHEINATDDKFGRNEQFCVSKCIGADRHVRPERGSIHAQMFTRDGYCRVQPRLPDSSLRDRVPAPESPRVGPQSRDLASACNLGIAASETGIVAAGFRRLAPMYV